jgi:actin-related protein
MCSTGPIITCNNRTGLTSFLQESLAATYGAGISNACVVNVGATTTNIACVDEGMVLSETRCAMP